MTENYNYPDTHEMLELHDILEELLASVDKGIHNKTTKYGLPTY